MQRLIPILILVLNIAILPVLGQNMPVAPFAANGLYTIQSGNTTITVNGPTGARIVSYKLDDNEILVTRSLNSRFYGSTLWVSPQSKWKNQGVLESGDYRIDTYPAYELLLKSQKDSLSGLLFIKHLKANPKDTSIIISYTIKNSSKEIKEVAPWEVTRVPAGGLAFIPKGPSGNIPTANLKLCALLTYRDSIGTIWYPPDISTSSAQKLYMDGGEGCIAYVLNNVIFIKKIPVIESNKIAPEEKNIELYVNKGKTYIEMENQGAYHKLNPGDSLVYSVTWYARQLPSGVIVNIGSQSLLNYARSIIQREIK